MATFFDWFAKNTEDALRNKLDPSNQSTEPSAESTEPTNDEPVVLFVTPGNEVEVPAAEAANSTIGELFSRYAEVLGIDPEQVSRFSDAGRVINRGSTPVPGRIYQGSANSFTKG
jgi:hypothetical protein